MKERTAVNRRCWGITQRRRFRPVRFCETHRREQAVLGNHPAPALQAGADKPALQAGA